MKREIATLKLIIQHLRGFDKAVAAHRLASLEREDTRPVEQAPYDPSSKRTGLERAIFAHTANKKTMISGVAHRIA